MRIGLIAPPWIPVPPPAYGGTEAVIDNLARGLAALGHDVRLFTVGESACPVRRQWLFRSSAEPMETAPWRTRMSWPPTRRWPGRTSSMTTPSWARGWPDHSGLPGRRW